MQLSVIVPTLNARERLLSCLDALGACVPDATEVIVVNGPSSDGTTGAVRDRDDVDVLVEISERNVNVSRNAGIETATGDVVALLGEDCTVTDAWYPGLENAVDGGAEVVTGPVGGGTSPTPDPKTSTTVGGRSVVGFDGDNVAFDRTVLEALDGFDEYLSVGGVRDCAHRLTGLGFDVTWSGEFRARRDVGTDGGHADDVGEAYRALAYRLSKNYGLRPTALARTAGSALADAASSARAVVAGDAAPSSWLTDGAAVVENAALGVKDGVAARRVDRSVRRNPNGVSTRHDRAVRIYDRR